MTLTHNHPVLKVTGLKKAYGAIQAVGGVSFEVRPGEIFGVIGPNGSGKTTLFNSMLGQITPDEGKIELNGQDVTTLGPLELNRLGVGRTFQTLQVFGKMTVRDNLIVAAQEHQGTLLSRMFAPGDIVQVARPLPWVVGDVDIAFVDILRADAADEMGHGIGHRVHMARCARDSLRQHLALGVINPSRQIPRFADRGGKGRAHQRLGLFFHDRDQPVPHDLVNHLRACHVRPPCPDPGAFV